MASPEYVPYLFGAQVSVEEITTSRAKAAVNSDQPKH
jgi:hypothetical protein